METKRIALIPAYEPDARLVSLAESMTKRGFSVLIVDDGSGPDYGEIFSRAEPFGRVLHHDINRGKGAAVKTGLTHIAAECPAGCTVVTVDADGQHLPQDAERVAAAAEAEPGALILGSRSFRGKVPLRSRLGNGVTRLVFRLSTGVRVYDTQTGLRAFSGALLPALLAVEGERYEYEMNVLMRFTREGIPIREVPIETVYLDGNRSSHFSTLRDSCRIYREILKFSASSLASFGLDYGLYCALTALTGMTVLPNVLARLVSAGANYTLNRKLVFNSRAGVGSSLLQYGALACGILAVNTACLWLLTSGLGCNPFAAKLLVEGLLFLVSYGVQKRWIFPAERHYKERTV